MHGMHTNNIWPGVGAALVLPPLVLLLRWVPDADVMVQSALALFVISIALSALLGGIVPGLLATLICVLLAKYYMLPPLHTFSQFSTLADIPLALLLVGVIFSVLLALLRSQRTRLHQLQRAAEQRAEDQRASEELLSTVFHSAPVAIMIVRLSDGHLVDVNSAFVDLWGYSREEVLGRTSAELGLWIEPTELIQQLKMNRNSDAQELKIRNKAGETREVIASVSLIHVVGSAHLLVTASDVTERKRAREMEHIAYHDILTNLPNRLLLKAKLREARERAVADGALNAVLFVDLDRFKEVNDTLGHDAGDELLRLVAARLKNRIRTADTVARVGGDEFVVLLERLHDAREAELIASELIMQMSTAFVLARGREVRIGASIGISYFAADSADVESLIQQADAALYAAKSAGRNTVRVFEKGVEA